ncbi:alkyl sulfatase dimerization domain-containing protein [Burkholderia sp. Ac-20365]|jgi:alkyl sulfatase BDS1-like metallo-beta-lactamase superfamily hydrolase|uniref:alkyl/aryl-sulfatase n=1 Tax=Burkholderia sp. Ac-20365 TaxID=2703897 RepID=UPI00197C34BE|nr:alkyl sulfatase dimerization domain-containing protein [Burkholderia sp. Ac-20365]MBN3762223.1 MBL fold metallo-hydrolase [Burkholderia sp. Ac-20365]
MSQSDDATKGEGRRAFLKNVAVAGMATGLSGTVGDALAQTGDPGSTGSAAKPASRSTLALNQQYADFLSFADAQDFEDARRGLVATLAEPVIIKGQGDILAWNLQQFAFVSGGPENNSPPTVNPSLWRNAKLNMNHGLFTVVDGIWQVRGYDLSVMSIIRGDKGYIVVDPFITTEVASTVWKELVIPHLGDKPITHVIYTHSHVDHYGGVRGLVSDQDLQSGKVKIVAPVGFTEAAVGENVIAGNAMGRRASYMYGSLLPRSPTGIVDGGLGKTTSVGTITLAFPSIFAEKTGQKMTLDGVDLTILMAPESEAPSEFMFYLPKYKAFCAAEDATHTLHNLYTLRGAKVRDGLLWSKYLQTSIEMFGGDAQVLFASHYWPTWGNERIVPFLSAQRDMYRYLHDQTLRMANMGMTALEIGEAIRLPDSLAKHWYCRSYYGTVYHDAVAQYNLRLGFFDGVPANLHRLQPTDSGKRYVEYMGGAAAVLRKAHASYDKGDYRWVAEVVNHVVFADPQNVAAKQLLADAYEQLGYQAESAPWRNFYLTGAMELRNGVKKLPAPQPQSPDTIRAMPLDMFLDFLGIRLNGERAAGKTATFNLSLTDTKENYILGVENSALHYSKGRSSNSADASVTMTREDLNNIMLGTTNMQKLIMSGTAKVDGNSQKLGEFLTWLDNFDFWFNIVTP